jgi:tRNA-dihydrouridine synthase
MKRHTGCDAVMIGRGALSNPWVFSRLDRDQVPPEQVRATVRKHLEKSVAFYGEEDGQRLFRKYAVQYLLLKTLDRETRKDILSQRPTSEFMALLDQVYATTGI